MWRSKHTGFAQSILYKVLLFSLLLCGGGKELCAQFYPIHAVVQWPSPQSPHLVDYYSGSRDRLIITLHNRDLQQPLLLARLRFQIKSNGFLAQTREELSYPQLELMAGVPTRLTATDLMPYLRPESLLINGRLRNGQFPTGFTEISVQVVDYYSQQVLSSWHTARAYLDSKQPPMLNLPQRDEQVAYRDPLFIRFQWYPRHQGLAGTEYEFVLKELPDNGAAPQAAFAYGNEIYRTRTRHTTLNYTHLEPILLPNRRYAWQVQAIARDGVDELGLFEHGGFSEIYWFTLNENCPVPTGLKADPRYAKVDFSWNRVVGATGYMLACRPKTSKDIYEWSEVQSYGERMTLAQLKPGWTYEWRVGTLCTGDKPIYSAIQEVTLPKSNVDLLRDCGKEPPRANLSPDPALDIQVGDTVTIGGDYPMVITQLQGLGDGWYSGRGTTRLSSIIELPRVALRFDRLRINIEKCQIDGLVEAIYADQPGGIADLDKIDDGGKRVQPSKLRIRERKVDFALGEISEMSFDPETGELEVTDAEGKPQRIKLDLPEGGASASAFPMIITDSKGDSYQLSPAESSEVSSSGASSSTSSTEGRVGTKQGLKVERVERIGSFDASRLAHGIGPVRFEPSAQARYAFDSGTESWYQGSVKLDEYYKPFAKGYIAPWKLIPTGEQDVVAARYEGEKAIDLRRVRFATSPNSPALPAELHEESKTWSLKLPGTDAQSSYDVYAIYEGQVLGKLRVVSYPKQHHKLTLVPVNEAKLDKAQIERELNSIYDSVGIHFDVEVDARMRGNYSWDRDGDGKLSVVGKSFFGRVREVKESAEMEYLKKAYTQLAGTLDGVYLFVVDAAGGLESQPKDLLGEMPRRSRFGYIFSGNSPNGGVSALSHTIAHELGHGLFTLQHTFDDEYGGTESQGQTRNLMDYTTGKELAAFQWNVLANPAVFTVADNAEEVRFLSGFALSPKLDLIRVRDSRSLYVASLYNDQLVQGTLPGFIVVKPSGQTEAYAWNRATYSSVESGKPYNPTTVETAKGPIYLFYNLDQECGKKAYMVVRYSDLSEVFKYKRRGQIEQAKRALLRVIERNQASSKVLKCEDSRKSSNDAWVEQPVPLNCDTGDIVALQRRYQEALKSKLDGNLDELVGLLKQYQDEPCFFEHVGIHERIKILNRLIRDDVDDSIWEFSYGKLSVGDTFFLDKLLLSTPESDRLTLLKEGFIANGGKWLQILFSKSKGFWNNDVTIPDLLPLMSELGHWVQLYYKDLSIPITTGVVNGIGISGFDELKYSLASVTPVCLGTGRDSDNFFYTRQADNGLLYDLRLNPNSWGRIVFQDGHITFVQHFVGQLHGEYLHTSDKRLPRAYNITTQLPVSPFEPVVIIASRDYKGLGIKAGVEYTIPAFLAAVYQQYLADNALGQDIRTLGNYAAITAAVLTAPLTEGGSLVTYSAIASGIVASADEALKSGRLKLGSSEAYDAQYEDFYQAWEQLYNVAAWTDGGVGVAQLYRSIRAVSIAKSIKRLVAESKLCGKEAAVAKALGVPPVKLVGLPRLPELIRKNRQLVELLGQIKSASGKTLEQGVDGFVKRFKDLYESCPKESIKSLDELLDDFEYLVNEHLPDLAQRHKQDQLAAFINEMMQTTDKFKAGATTLEVIRHPEKYVSPDIVKLSNIELEGRILSTAAHRFDVKWMAIVENYEQPINVYVDTKNYTSVSDMFRDLGQFKAYLGEISSFEQLRIIQQARPGMSEEKVIKQLERMIAKDARSVFDVNRELWYNMGLKEWVELAEYCSTKQLSQHPAFRRMIKLTK